MKAIPTIDRVLDRVAIDDNDCWLWTGGISEGYGRIYVPLAKSGYLYTHRISYEHFIGPIPDGLVIDHLCRNRRCCNPEHLEPVSRGENVRRGVLVKPRVTVCRRGHAYDAENTYTNPLGYQVCRTCKRLRREVAANV